MKLITKVIILIMVFIGSAQVFASDSFRHEINVYGGASKEDAKNGPDGETTAFGLGYAFYFNPVMINESQPLAEAAFLNKAGYVGIIGLKTKYEIGENGYDTEIDSNGLGLVAEYVFPKIPIIVSAEYLRAGGESSGDYYYEYDYIGNSFGLSLGYYITDNIAAKLVYDYGKTDYDFDNVNDDTSSKESSYGCKMKAVLPVIDQKYLNLEMSYLHERDKFESDIDDDYDYKNNEYSVLADFYITPKIGVGAGVTINRGDDKEDEGEIYMARAGFFVTSNIGIGLTYENFRAKDRDEGDNEQGVDLELTARF